MHAKHDTGYKDHGDIAGMCKKFHKKLLTLHLQKKVIYR